MTRAVDRRGPRLHVSASRTLMSDVGRTSQNKRDWMETEYIYLMPKMWVNLSRFDEILGVEYWKSFEICFGDCPLIQAHLLFCETTCHLGRVLIEPPFHFIATVLFFIFRCALNNLHPLR